MVKLRCVFGVFAGFLAVSTAACAQEVDLALAIAIDVSYSVDATEHRLQMKGFADALITPEVLEAIKAGEKQKIALLVYQWADVDNQRVVIPWTVIDGVEAAAKVAKILARGPRVVAEGGTGISGALLFGSALFGQAPKAIRNVIDLSTDGRNNMGRPTKPVRDFVVAQGVTVNGLAISNEWKNLSKYLETNVIGGPASFVEEAYTYDDFGAAMQRKLLKEIVGPGVM
jgi:Protein of unknown function (DUF1194)